MITIFFQAFFRDVTPLTSLKQNGCYFGREGFLCSGISDDELRDIYRVTKGSHTEHL